VGLGDLVYVDLDEGSKKLVFSKRSGGALISDLPEFPEETEDLKVKSGGAALPLPQTKVARKSQGRGEKSEA